MNVRSLVEKIDPQIVTAIIGIICAVVFFIGLLFTIYSIECAWYLKMVYFGAVGFAVAMLFSAP